MSQPTPLRLIAWWVVALVAAAAAAGGCATGPANPSFAVEPDDARRALRRMADARRPLRRPVVILGGFADPGIGPHFVERTLGPLVHDADDRVLVVSFPLCTSFDACRRRVIDAVDRAFPCDEPGVTAEVDVIGLSMGGVVARYASAPRPADGGGAGGRRLRIARLFTVSSPHRGATLAALPALTPLHADMRRGSAFLRALDDALPAGGYALYPYVRLGDAIVGERNAAPAGRSPYWVPNLPLEASHLQASRDPRILADIARRLRGEAPLASDPPAPLPGVDAEPRAAHHSS